MEMENEKLFAKIQELLNGFDGDYNIIDRQIDINLQLEYFESSKIWKANLVTERVMNEYLDLLVPETLLPEKKRLLVELASIDQVEAFRIIEKYMENPEEDLRDWGTLALYQSKMLIEGSLLEQNQVFISTGLGGRKNKLRYFVVFLLNEGLEMNDFRMKIAESEIGYSLKSFDVEVESISYNDKYISSLVLSPIKVPLQEVFETVVKNCNQFGAFIQSNFIVTNVKELNLEEILEIISSSKNNSIDNNFFPDKPQS